MKVGKRFQQLRSERGMSLADVAVRAGMNRTTIWKIEKGDRLPRGGTFRAACLLGLGIAKSSPEWEELRALWTAERTGQPVEARALAGQISKHSRKARGHLDSFMAAVAVLSQEDFAELDKAVRRPAVIQALRALNLIHDSPQP